MFNSVMEKAPSLRARDYLNPVREEVLGWFIRNAPSLGELYQGAVDLINLNPALPGRSRFIAHAVREIRNRLPDVISGLSSKRLDYVTRLDEISKLWNREGLPMNGSYPIPPATNDITVDNTISVPRPIFKKVASLIEDHVNTREKPMDAAIRLFVSSAPLNPEFIDQLRPTIDLWLEVTNWFVKFVHDSGRTDKEYINQEYEDKFILFEITLGSILRGFFSTTEELDAILVATNTNRG